MEASDTGDTVMTALACAKQGQPTMVADRLPAPDDPGSAAIRSFRIRACAPFDQRQPCCHKQMKRTGQQPTVASHHAAPGSSVSSAFRAGVTPLLFSTR